jgi:hypothetical protein
LLLYPPEQALEALNIRKETLNVIIKGEEYSINYLNR